MVFCLSDKRISLTERPARFPRPIAKSAIIAMMGARRHMMARPLSNSLFLAAEIRSLILVGKFDGIATSFSTGLQINIQGKHTIINHPAAFTCCDMSNQFFRSRRSATRHPSTSKSGFHVHGNPSKTLRILIQRKNRNPAKKARFLEFKVGMQMDSVLTVLMAILSANP